MIPYKSTTRDKMIQVAMELRKRTRKTSIELSRLSCYHEILEKDLNSTIVGDNYYWQKRKSVKIINEEDKYLSHTIRNSKSKRYHHSRNTSYTSYDPSDGYKSDGEVSI